MDPEEARELAAAEVSQSVLEDVEKRYYSIRQERDGLQSSLEQVQTQLNDAKQKLLQHQQLEQRASEFEHQLKLEKEQTRALNEEKTLAQERLDRLIQEADNLREELRYVGLSGVVLHNLILNPEKSSNISSHVYTTVVSTPPTKKCPPN